MWAPGLVAGVAVEFYGEQVRGWGGWVVPVGKVAAEQVAKVCQAGDPCDGYLAAARWAAA